ncbi:hypothetical protein D3C78_1733400 [compost metagenome]
MGVYKWEQLGLDYPLEGVQSPTDKEVERARGIIEIGRQSASSLQGELNNAAPAADSKLPVS